VFSIGSGSIYVTGGKGRSGKVHDECFKYDCKSKKWTKLHSMRKPRERHGMVVLNGMQGIFVE